MKNIGIIKGIIAFAMALSIIGSIFIISQGSMARIIVDENVAVQDNPDFELNVVSVIDLDRLKSYGLPIIIDFGSDDCIPCKEMAPILMELNGLLRGKAIIKFVDVKKNVSLIKGFPIRLIPTQLFIGRDGKPFIPVDLFEYRMSFYDNPSGEHLFTRHEGGMTKSQLINVLKEMGVAI